MSKSKKKFERQVAERAKAINAEKAKAKAEEKAKAKKAKVKVAGVGAGRDAPGVNGAPVVPPVPPTDGPATGGTGGVPPVGSDKPMVLRQAMSALDAAARVLAESEGALNCPAIYKAMVDKALWSSPTGKTPAATLHTAIITEIKKKGEKSRFVKVDRGLFGVAGRTYVVAPAPETAKAPDAVNPAGGPGDVGGDGQPG